MNLAQQFTLQLAKRLVTSQIDVFLKLLLTARQLALVTAQIALGIASFFRPHHFKITLDLLLPLLQIILHRNDLTLSRRKLFLEGLHGLRGLR